MQFKYIKMEAYGKIMGDFNFILHTSISYIF